MLNQTGTLLHTVVKLDPCAEHLRGQKVETKVNENNQICRLSKIQKFSCSGLFTSTDFCRFSD